MDKNRSKKYFIYRAISIILIVSVMIFNLFGDTLRDYADPKNRK